MFIAVDSTGERVFAQKFLSKEGQYYCPVCNGEVRLRTGNINAAHFAHIQPCTDDFTTDMSEWHKAWQMLFPIKNREVVITNGNDTHRADVLCYGTVIEFQHSPISESEFWRRNDFYTSAGYKVVWIFDVINQVSAINSTGDLSFVDEWHSQWDNGGKFKWKYPWRFLGRFMPQEQNNIDIFFNMLPFGENPKRPEADGYIERVAWVNPNYKTLWGWFHTSYKVCNYADLLLWLESRWTRQKRNSNK